MRFSDGWTSGNVYIRIRPPFLSFPLPSFRVHSAVHLIDLCNYLDGQRLVGSRTRRRSQRISFFFFNSLETRNFDYVHSLIRHCCFLLSSSMWYWTRRKIGREREGKGGKGLFEEKSWWCWSWISLVQSETRVFDIIRWNDIFFFES